jgi:hypothetical protein
MLVAGAALAVCAAAFVAGTVRASPNEPARVAARKTLAGRVGATVLPAVGGFAVSVSRRRLAYRKDEATLSIRMITGPTAETVGIQVDTPSWPDPNVEGSPLGVAHERIVGAGRITGHSASSGGGRAAYSSVCSRGPGGGAAVAVSLPAQSRTTLSYRVALAAPPWPGAALSLAVTAGIPASAPDPASQITTYPLGTLRFTAASPSGVQIKLSALAGTHRDRRALYPAVRHGRRVIIGGETAPRLNHQPLQIGYQSTITGRRGTIGTIETDHDGRFKIIWRPEQRGIYTITAGYQHPASGLLADHACDLALSVD